MRGRLHWGYAIATVYAIFASGTLGLAFYALERPVDLVSLDYYARALDQDRHRRAIENGALPQARPRAERSSDGRRIVLTWPAMGATISGSVRLYRASNSADDRVWSLAPDSAGRQDVVLDGLPAGRWTLQLAWRAGGADYYVEFPVTTP
jgi:hypothetical protein